MRRRESRIHKAARTAAFALLLSVSLTACQSGESQDAPGTEQTTEASDPEITSGENETEPTAGTTETVQEEETSDEAQMTQPEETTQEETDSDESETVTESSTDPAETLEPTDAPEPTQAPAPTETPAPTQAPESTEAPAPTEAPEAEGENQFLEGSLEEIMEAIYANVTSDLPMIANVEITAENAAYYLGTDEVEFEEAMASEAMIITTPYSVCLARLPEGADVEAAKEQIVQSVNPNKWICVGVEPRNVLVGSIDNMVLLVMTSEMSQEIMDAFLSLQEAGEQAEVLSQAVSPDDNGMLLYQGHAAMAPEEYNETSAIRLGEKIESIYETCLDGQTNVYYSVIPDKSFFIPNTILTTEDYFMMISTLQQTVEHAEYIPLIYELSLSDYYQTDLHWRQEELFGVVNVLGNAMGFEVEESDFSLNTLSPYRGVYASYMENAPGERMSYLVNRNTENAEVSIYEAGTYTGVYLLDQWETDVPYNLFLGGPNPLVEITNPDVDNGKELIIFGDSFMSSLAPLLTGVYEKITLIDLRFVMSAYLPELVEFNGQDVLFLYNTAVVNNSSMLK